MDRKEWLRWRHKGIGSSDAAVVLGISPYTKTRELWAEKILDEPVEEKDSGNYITDQGNRWEPHIRKLVEMEEFEEFAPSLRIHPDYDFIRASTDGQTADGKKLVEIKIIGKEPYEKARDLKEVPPHYMAQMQHQLMVTGAEVCIFACHLFEKGMTNVYREKLALVYVKPDFEYQVKLLEAELNFWNNHVLTKIEPPETSEDYKPIRKAKALTAALAEWKAAQADMKKVEVRLKNARDKMLNAAIEAEKATGHKRFSIDGEVRIRQEERQGSIDYKKIPAIAGMTEAEFAEYRGPKAFTWKVELIKSKEEEK